MQNKRTPNVVVIPPQGKRRKRIIFRAIYAEPNKEEQEHLEDVIALQMARFGLFDTNNQGEINHS